jgi:hypothetical protein
MHTIEPNLISEWGGANDLPEPNIFLQCGGTIKALPHNSRSHHKPHTTGICRFTCQNDIIATEEVVSIIEACRNIDTLCYGAF